MASPIAIDLCCGLGGWTAGLLAEGYRVIGFDIARPKRFPTGALFVQQDIATIDGTRWRGRVALVVASPPCTEFSQAWNYAKHRQPDPLGGMELVHHAFRIGRECGADFLLENVAGARVHFLQQYGPPSWHVGPFYFWGGAPVLRPHGRFVKGITRDKAERARIPLELARAAAAQHRVGAWWRGAAYE